MFVRFSETYTVKAADGKTYDKGKTYELSAVTCRHFVNKGVAVVIPSAGSAEPETASVAPPEKAVRKVGRPRTATTSDG